MKKYIVRSLKYFFALCVLCIALMGLMLMTGTSALSLDDTLYVMLHTDRYLMLFAAIVALAAVYPRSPLDGAGNSVKAQKALAFIAGHLNLNVFGTTRCVMAGKEPVKA